MSYLLSNKTKSALKSINKVCNTSIPTVSYNKTSAQNCMSAVIAIVEKTLQLYT